MDNKTLHDRFRQQLTNVHALTVLTVSLFEIIGYITLVLSGIEQFSPHNAYLWYGVVFPIAVNAVTHLVARRSVNAPSVSRRKKNKAIIAATLVTSLVVAVIHKEYIVTSCAFIFPIVLSATFNDRKLLNASFIASILILICVGIAFWLDQAVTLTTALNLFILFGFAFIAYLCGVIFINFSGQNYSTIESQAKQNTQLQEDVLRDQMTGLYNHNAFVMQLEKAVAAFHEDAPLCLAMIDVDNFKSINDTYGHDCGDVVLICLAKTIQKHCAEQGLAYRYGGEEFAAVFEGKDTQQVCRIVQNMLADFRRQRFPFTDRAVTFSAGVAAYTPGMAKDAFFEQADRTLYLAKQQGKNRVLKAE